MKRFFTGLMLLCFAAANAQNSPAVQKTNSTQQKNSLQKVRAVMHWDEQQHEAKAPVNLNSSAHFNPYHFSQPSSALHINYVEQHRSYLLEGVGYGLLLAKSFSRYSNTPNMTSGDLQSFYRIPQYNPVKQ